LSFYDYDDNQVHRIVFFPTGIAGEVKRTTTVTDQTSAVPWSTVARATWEVKGDGETRLPKLILVCVFDHAMIRIAPADDKIRAAAGAASNTLEAPAVYINWPEPMLHIEATGTDSSADILLYCKIRGHHTETGLPAYSPKGLVTYGIGAGELADSHIFDYIWKETTDVEFLHEKDALIFELGDVPDGVNSVTYAEIKVTLMLFGQTEIGSLHNFAVNATKPGLTPTPFFLHHLS